MKDVRAGRVSTHRWLLLLPVALAFACEQPRPATRGSSMPELRWTDPAVPAYGNALKTPERSWRAGVEQAKSPLAAPDALETRLRPRARAVWREGLEALERYREHNRDMLRIATALWPEAPGCDSGGGPPPTLPPSWHLEAQMLIQQRRHVFWYLGRLELAARSTGLALDTVQRSFDPQRASALKDALIQPVTRAQRQLQSYDTPMTRPDGAWSQGDLGVRFARHRPLLLLLTRLEEAILDWQQRTREDERWGYAVRHLDPVNEAIQTWYSYHDAMIEAVSAYARQLRRLKRVVGRAAPDDPTPIRCVRTLAVRLSRASTMHVHTLHMQKELAALGRSTRSLLTLVEEGPEHEELRALQTSILEHARDLMQLEAATLHRIDHDANLLWRRYFPSVAQIETPSPDRNALHKAWRRDDDGFFQLRRSYRPRRRGQPEPRPPEPRRRRRKKPTPFITRVLDLARSPGAVAGVEKGLLGISELESHMEAMHASILEACQEGDCTGLPEAGLPHSPRGSEFAELWSALPVEQRSLGHHLLVLELTRLHLSRQVDRLADFHAWFAELSSADASWPLLSAWDQTWDLYTGLSGSYLIYLQDMAHILDAVDDFAEPSELKSERLEYLMRLQRDLVELTIDYARFSDQGREAPIPVATLLDTWNSLHRELIAIEEATLARDARVEEAEAKAREAEKRTP